MKTEPVQGVESNDSPLVHGGAHQDVTFFVPPVLSHVTYCETTSPPNRETNSWQTPSTMFPAPCSPTSMAS
ncbi:hypothetical protein BOSE62_130463 [Bosea sp. 62]|nr:hypothetical protein BOSE7B_120472 [Bosea sp. 7B]CAD5276995.1 hypothetical protein BOSE21B_30441 [Bosea sp. 21B]CAD5278094.1 hypothetical protein BOSE46_40088 [Bosea sp. 46]VVT59820.1 hypothetical protein BOS5A_210611 [Bosea sp. EC-HK365B]VXB44610.1 hypothetical protein BOSE62_130463 [Bosea sp. 62]VXC06179.1 hypothetical protein BOSE127_170112 [Bosea sp. 127]VXC24368.1 hypothetical protein BOSE29B_30416 [Bosea sp. 29B]VXC76109.1 hypothetical protein BOSE125_50088 [Bosea sp. 125]